MDKEQARNLRLSGKSYKEVSEILRIPKSTLSGWFGKSAWSIKIRDRLSGAAQATSTVRLLDLNKMRRNRLDQIYKDARKEAREELETLKYDPLFIAGLILYWGEGDKVSRGIVRLVNTDPSMIRLYKMFLVHACGVPEEKIRAHITIYPDLDGEICTVHWSETSGIPRRNFIKNTTISGRHKTKRLTYGMCTVYVSSTYFKVKILEWIRLLSMELMDGR
ncbi:MAG TPA: hypothetical protein VHO23_03310 [Candidatus Paceibacterota bacterium]|nr:hypothetical protein [Candidatus Paceibacterota bacterium]